jgi:hypothetical protein
MRKIAHILGRDGKLLATHLCAAAQTKALSGGNFSTQAEAKHVHKVRQR